MSCTFTFPVPKGVTEFRITTPNSEKLAGTGPRWVEVKEGWTRSYKPIEGGPGTIRVTKVGQVRGGHRMVTVELVDMTATYEAVLHCKPAPSQAVQEARQEVPVAQAS
ncbi:MAG: hypothetical protein H6760_01485 [Candidatus Nomurabacteria bacterium]|nr:MAG: hypothetical protein H6760_01485 [Candidatus Nomurabacteria bacterium]